MPGTTVYSYVHVQGAVAYFLEFLLSTLSPSLICTALSPQQKSAMAVWFFLIKS